MVKKTFFLTILLIGLFLLGLTLPNQLLAQTTKSPRLDATALELDLSKRIESLIEKLVGPGRTIVKVTLFLTEEAKITIQKGAVETEEKEAKTTELRGMPGMAVIEAPARQANRYKDIVSVAPRIEKMYIKILVDEKLEKEKITLIKETVPSWSGLDASRGDILEIQPVPWKEITPLPIEVLSSEQLKVGKRNVLVGLSILALLLMVIGLIVAAVLGFVKPPRGKKEAPAAEGAGMATEGTERIVGAISKLGEELSNWQSQTTGEGKAAASSKIDSLLEDIKEILSHPPAAGAAAAVAGVAAAAQGAAGPERAGGGPGSGGEAAGGGGTAIAESLSGIQDLLKKQLMGENPLDKPFEFISANLSAQGILKLVEGEKEEILLHILANLEPKKSAEVLSALPEEQSIQTISKMGSLKETSPEITKSIRELLDKKLKEARLAGGAKALGGSEVLSRILSVSSDKVTQSVLDNLTKINPQMAKETRKKIFLFEDIANLDEKTLGLILNNMPRDTLKLALKYAPQVVLDKIFSSMTERGVAILKEDLEVMADVAESQSKQAQRAMLDVIRELKKKGVISIKEGGI